MGINYVFQVTPLRHPDALIPQLSRALRLHAELDFRHSWPRLCTLLDRWQRNVRLYQSAPLVPLLIWSMSLCLLIPTLLFRESLAVPLLAASLCFGMAMACLWQDCRPLLSALSLSTGILLTWGAASSPSELGILLPFGILGLCLGAAALPVRRTPVKHRSVRAAEALVARYMAALDGNILELAFSAEQMILFSFRQNAPDIALPEKAVPYGSFSHIIETEELLLLFCEGSLFLVQKEDLVTGRMEHFLDVMAHKADLRKVI